MLHAQQGTSWPAVASTDGRVTLWIRFSKLELSLITTQVRYKVVILKSDADKNAILATNNAQVMLEFSKSTTTSKCA